MSYSPSIRVNIRGNGKSNRYGSTDYRTNGDPIDFYDETHHIQITSPYTFDSSVEIEGTIEFV